MKPRSVFSETQKERSGFRFTAGLLLFLAPQLWAQSGYLTAGAPDGVALLPPPPASGSAEEAADLQTVRSVFGARTQTEEKRAFKDATLAFSLFAPIIGPEFDAQKLPKTWALLQEVKKEIGGVIDTPKDFFKRRRPYVLDPQLSLGKPEPSFSYPSGHSTRGTVYSLLLAEIFPAHRDAILELGRDIGWDRVLIGKHYPSDVLAGRVLGQAIVRELRKSAQFERDLAHAKAEAAEVDATVQAQRPSQPQPAGVGR